jgi:pimeloyl-ACP methyl ester carboxylesterase
MSSELERPLRLYCVSSREGPRKSADIVFIHGLTGSAAQTWSLEPGAAKLWPRWLSGFADVWVLDYPADLFWWATSGASMPLPERARSVLDLLVNNGLGDRPLIFIAHSLGGLLVKAMLRAAQSLRNRDWQRLLKNTKGIAFLATPHTGAALGTIANALRVIGVSHNATQLLSNEGHLLDLSTWYSENADELGITTLAYYEKGRYKGIKVVDETSSNPNVRGCIPIPVDANHLEICKPKDQYDPVYLGILRFVAKLLGSNHLLDEKVEPSLEKGDFNVENVFGVVRGDTSNYVQRHPIDDIFVESLVLGKHVCIYGSSKQGKTALRKKYISKNESLVVVCNPEWSCNDIFAAILRAAECVIVRDPNDPTGAQATATILDRAPRKIAAASSYL